MAQRLEVNAHRKRMGRMATEMLEVEPSGDGSYRVLRSPAYVQGLAEGDLFGLDAEGWVDWVTHGGNVCVQVFHRLDFAPLAQMRARVAALEGHGYDHEHEGIIVFTIPVTAGFFRIESPFTRIERLYGNRMTWRFGNVYAEDGETTLDWWVPDGESSPEAGGSTTPG